MKAAGVVCVCICVCVCRALERMGDQMRRRKLKIAIKRMLSILRMSDIREIKGRDNVRQRIRGRTKDHSHCHAFGEQNSISFFFIQNITLFHLQNYSELCRLGLPAIQRKQEILHGGR